MKGGEDLKKFEIKKVGPGSAFKVTLYFAIIPVAIMLLIGIAALIIGSATGQREVMMVGGIYVIMPVVLFFVYGAFGALFALLYNGLSSKFGGLEVFIDEHDNKKWDE